MDIDRIRYFQVFAAAGSLVKAAGLLRISQPALSKALRLLESETGLKLMEHEGRGLRLTDQGSAFRDETAPLLAQWMAVPAKIQGVRARAPTRLGSFEVFTTHFLGRLLDHVELEALDVLEFTPGRLEQAIVDGRVDVGITYLPIPLAGTEFVEAGKITMGVFGAAGAFKSRAWSELPFAIPVRPAEGTPSKVMGLDGWPEHKFPRQVKYRVTMMESALELCRQGRAVAYLPHFVVDRQNESAKAAYQLSELPSPVPRKDREQSVFLIRRSGAAESQLERRIARCLRSLSPAR